MTPRSSDDEAVRPRFVAPKERTTKRKRAAH
jgi:hypothetical protein